MILETLVKESLTNKRTVIGTSNSYENPVDGYIAIVIYLLPCNLYLLVHQVILLKMWFEPVTFWLRWPISDSECRHYFGYNDM
jgi:hypothetical protein